MNTHPISWKKYIIVLLITFALFLSAVYVSNYFDAQRLVELKTVQDKISLDLLSSETEFSILQELSCKDVDHSVLTPQLNDLGSKIQYSEKTIGKDNSEVINLKRYYTILQIKDYLLLKRISERCNLKSAFIFYMYSQKNCPECDNQVLVLNTLRDKYPSLHVYSFDYNMDLSVMKALIDTYKIPPIFPGLVINGQIYTGYKTVTDIEKLIPETVLDQVQKDKQKILDAQKQKML